MSVEDEAKLQGPDEVQPPPVEAALTPPLQVAEVEDVDGQSERKEDKWNEESSNTINPGVGTGAKGLASGAGEPAAASQSMNTNLLLASQQFSGLGVPQMHTSVDGECQMTT